MHEPSFLWGLELGKCLTRVTHAEQEIATLDKKLDAHIGRVRRVAILVSLWTFALLANASPDKAAEFAIEIVMSALRER